MSLKPEYADIGPSDEELLTGLAEAVKKWPTRELERELSELPKDVEEMPDDPLVTGRLKVMEDEWQRRKDPAAAREYRETAERAHAGWVASIARDPTEPKAWDLSRLKDTLHYNQQDIERMRAKGELAVGDQERLSYLMREQVALKAALLLRKDRSVEGEQGEVR